MRGEKFDSMFLIRGFQFFSFFFFWILAILAIEILCIILKVDDRFFFDKFLILST